MHATARRAASTGDPEGVAYAEQLASAADRLVEVTGASAGRGDQASMLADATAYLEATGHLVVAWLWLEQWLVADGKESAFYEGKRAATRYFFARELPKVGPMLDLLAAGDRTTLDLDPGVL